MNTYYICGMPITDELYHHGILGQKWGVRRYQNPDGTLTAEGKKRYGSEKEQKKLADLLTTKAGNTYNSRSINQARVKATPQVKHALAESANAIHDAARKENEADRRYEKLENDFYKDKKLYEEYLNKAVDARMASMNPDIDLWTRDEVYDWYRYDDGDQGTYSSLELFKKSDHPLAQRLNDAERQQVKAQKELTDISEHYAKEFLGAYGDQKLLNIHGLNSVITAQQRLAAILEGEAKRRNMSFSDRAAYGNYVD